MLWLAGLFGLMAVSGVSFGGDSENLDEISSDDTSEEDAVHGETKTVPLESILPASEPEPAEEIIIGSQDDQTLIGGDGNDQINGYEGNDTIDGGAGRDDLYGGVGIDVIDGGEGMDTVHGQDGDDVLSGGEGNDKLYGHNDDDQLNGDDGDDTLHGGMGNDILSGGDGDDAVHGGIGDDTLSGETGQDTLFGGSGNDVISGMSSTDGTVDTDIDYLNGGDGNDQIIAGEADVVTGGDGADTVIFGDWITKDSPASMTDYDSSEDQLIMVWDLQTSPDPDIEVLADESVAGLSHILVDGVEIASISGGQTLTADDIVLVDHSDMDLIGLNAA